jgi:predicted nucleic acid-binding protein
MSGIEKRVMKVFIDTDIFVRHLRYRNDVHTKKNDRFLNLLKNKKITGFTSIYNLLEVCGILSFNLSSESLLHLYSGFKERYQIKQILFGKSFDNNLVVEINSIFTQFSKKMSLGDALVTACVEYYRDLVDGFVTWNDKHFIGKLTIDVYTPANLLDYLKSNMST